MDQRVTVIIPAYQAGRYIRNSVKSVLLNNCVSQLIIVDDGSTDCTGEICRSLMKMDSRIQYVFQNNSGPGAAREKGISLASEDWLAFVDADDIIEPKTYDFIFERIKHRETDIIEFGYCTVTTEGEILEKHPLKNKICTGVQCAMHNVKQNNSTNFMCNKIFRSELFRDIKYPHLFAGEDAAILAQVHVKAQVKQVVSGCFYHYVQTPGSLCRTAFSEKSLDDIDAYKFIDAFYMKHSPELCIYSRQKICSLAVNRYLDCKDSKLDLSQKRKIEKEMCAVFNEYRKKIGIKQIISIGTLQRRAMLFLFFLSPKLCLFCKRQFIR